MEEEEDWGGRGKECCDDDYDVYASCFYVLNKFVIEIRQRKSKVILHECRDHLVMLTDFSTTELNVLHSGVLFQPSGK